MSTQITQNPVNLILPDAPELSGLRFRLCQGESDFPGMLAVINAAWNADQQERTYTLESLRNDFKKTPNFDPEQDLLIAEVHGVIIALGRARWWAELAEANLVFQPMGFVHPAWRRQGLGRAILRYNQAHLRETALRLEAQYPREKWHYVYECFAMNFQPGAHALLLSEGYQPQHEGHQMVCPNLEDVPDLPLPAGIEVRPVRPEHYRQIWDASQEAFRDHRGYSAPSEEDYQSWLGSEEFQPDLWQVAWDGDQIAGMVQNFINPLDNETYGRLRGWTEGISVRRPWRRKGLARALLARSMRMHRSLGMQETGLGVDTGNPNKAMQLYESMGYRTTLVYTYYRKEME